VDFADADSHWTAIVDPAVLPPTLLFATTVGLTGVLYPALGAASVQSLEVLRS
jgi:ABC-type antimicrobial peptide transport system permease subunit